MTMTLKIDDNDLLKYNITFPSQHRILLCKLYITKKESGYEDMSVYLVQFFLHSQPCTISINTITSLHWGRNKFLK